MAIDYFLVLIITVVIALAGYAFILARNKLNNNNYNPNELLADTGMTNAAVSLDWFTNAFNNINTAKSNYEQIKANLPILSDCSSSEEQLNHSKALRGALLKRSIVCVETAHQMNKKISSLETLLNQPNNLTQEEHQTIQSTADTIKSEIKLIEEEANSIQADWGGKILQQAADMSIGVKYRQDARRAAELEAINKVKQADIDKANQIKLAEEAARRQAKLADRNYQLLMQQEARLANKSNKKMNRK
jgi:hypothetical protein